MNDQQTYKNDEQNYKINCETVTSLARVYKVDPRTMKKMLVPLINQGLINHKNDGRNVLTTNEVRIIIQEIGPPPGTIVIYD